MAGHSHYSEGYGPVGPAPKEHQAVYTTLHFDKPWSYENYLKTGGYAALRKIIEEKIPGSLAAEVWSLGATVYSLLAGHSPFEKAGSVQVDVPVEAMGSMGPGGQAGMHSQ